MQISARAEYAIRAALGLAAAHPATVSSHALAREQDLPHKFLEAIMADMRRAGLVRSMRGADGGYQLARPPGDIAVGAVLRAVEGPLAAVRGRRPEETSYGGSAVHLAELWVALRAAVRGVLDEVSLQQVVSGDLPDAIRRLVQTPGAWQPR